MQTSKFASQVTIIIIAACGKALDMSGICLIVAWDYIILGIRGSGNGKDIIWNSRLIIRPLLLACFICFRSCRYQALKQSLQNLRYCMDYRCRAGDTIGTCMYVSSLGPRPSHPRLVCIQLETKELVLCIEITILVSEEA